VVVVEDVTGGGIAVVVVCSVVVVLLTLSGLPQAAIKAVPVSSAATVKSRKLRVMLVMA
jgi:hypothetical protein